MLPGHGYPELKKYSHFYGNYGNAWWDQRKDFTNFNGPIVFTTNCIVPPLIMLHIKIEYLQLMLLDIQVGKNKS